MATTPPRRARKPLPFGLESFRTVAKRNPLLAVGMPLILFMFGGTFALQQFHEVRFKVRDRQTLVRSPFCAERPGASQRRWS